MDKHKQQQRELKRVMNLIDIRLWDMPQGARNRGNNRPGSLLYQPPQSARLPLVPNASLPSQNNERAATPLVVGGEPITLELAQTLREKVYGSCIHSFGSQWRASHLDFYDISSAWPYGLKCLRDGSRGVQLCVQAYILRELIYPEKSRKSFGEDNVVTLGLDPTKERKYSSAEAEKRLCPSEEKRTAALCSALTTILWKAGQGKRACLCLPRPRPAFESPYGYREDRITERIQLFYYDSRDELQQALEKYLHFFQMMSHHGTILFLYSVVLSRGLDGIATDMDGSGEALLKPNEQCTVALMMLLLTGRAARFFHNGKLQIYDDKGNIMIDDTRTGIHTRSDVGFLFWHKDEEDKHRTTVEANLRTPRWPIWVTQVNGAWGVAFCLNAELVSNYVVENYFNMFYYNGLSNPNRACRLTINNRQVREITGRTKYMRAQAEKRIPALERCIMTKWREACVDWNDMPDFF